MWFVTSQKHGASALGIQRVLGLGSYQTAWTWLHKLRRAMVRPERSRLHDSVEVDETYVGGTEKGVKRGRGAERKEIVVIAVEVHEPKGFGRVRMRRIPDASGASLVPFVRDVVERDSEILTDGWLGYNGLIKHGYKHKKTVLSDSGDPAHVAMPGPHRIASLLKRWLLSTHQGAIGSNHLDYYLDEFTFRFNRRTSRSRGLLFYRLMQQSVATAPTRYRDLVGGTHNRFNRKEGSDRKPQRGEICKPRAKPWDLGEECAEAPKGRNRNSATTFISPPWGSNDFQSSSPRASPWAGIFRPFGACGCQKLRNHYIG